MLSLVEISPVVLEKKMKMWEGQTDGQMDRQTTQNRPSEKLTWALSSGELKITNWFLCLFEKLKDLPIHRMCQHSYNNLSWCIPHPVQYTMKIWITKKLQISGLQIILKLQGPCGFLTYQDLLAHIDILGPKYSMKFWKQ